MSPSARQKWVHLAELGEVAEMAARGAAPEAVFAGVVDAASALLGDRATALVRFEDDGTSVVLAAQGARVPPGGKLIELQVREGRAHWNTVQEAFHTDASGRFRLRYRFGRFYETNAHFVFRVKIAREQGWPYKAPGRSRAQLVTVVANR